MESLATTLVNSSKEKVPIGSLLVVDEVILPQDLDFALEHQKYSRQPLGEILVRMGALEYEDLDRVLELQNRSLSL
jgi:hypothetical protein